LRSGRHRSTLHASSVRPHPSWFPTPHAVATRSCCATCSSCRMLAQGPAEKLSTDQSDNRCWLLRHRGPVLIDLYDQCPPSTCSGGALHAYAWSTALCNNHVAIRIWVQFTGRRVVDPLHVPSAWLTASPSGTDVGGMPCRPA
jgi:hypothetical protein